MRSTVVELIYLTAASTRLSSEILRYATLSCYQPGLTAVEASVTLSFTLLPMLASPRPTPHTTHPHTAGDILAQRSRLSYVLFTARLEGGTQLFTASAFPIILLFKLDKESNDLVAGVYPAENGINEAEELGRQQRAA